MAIGNVIYKLRNDAKLSREQFAEIFGVSRQSVQKWESGAATPDLDKIIRISKYFDISIDSLVLDSDARITEELVYTKEIKPKYAKIHNYESYSSNLKTEYIQCVEEGLDITTYKDVFDSVARLPKDETKKKLGDVLYGVVLKAGIKENYKYIEPSDIDKIKALRRPYELKRSPIDKNLYKDKLLGAWLGRISGCMLGKTVEGIRTDELIPFLKETGNYPMRRYIYRSDINDGICEKYKFRFASRAYADAIDCMPSDDDTNYVVLAQKIIEKYGIDFTPYDVSRAWLKYQPKDAYHTAERVAFCNFVKGFEPPESAIYKNPFREWIGAQIRGDYFGYINPGDPELAAEMAWRDASISHVKNGIYGEMFISAMLAAAAVNGNIEDIILAGLAEIPHTSRLYEAITDVLNDFKDGVSQKEAFKKIHTRFDEHSAHDWCHTISNAMIVTASLLYGEGDFGKSICMAVETGFDTDCNGATVGSIIGMAYGSKHIGEYWTAPFNGKLKTEIFGVGTVNISDCVEKTLEHTKI